MAEIVDFQETISAARAGMVAGVPEVDAKVVDADMLVARLVVPGASDDSCKVPAASGDVAKALGVTVYLAFEQFPAEDGTNEIEQNDVAQIAFKGDVWVDVEDAVTAGDQPFVNFQNGNEGQFRSDAAGGDAEAVPNARYLTSTSGAGLAKVRLNFPGA